MKFFKCKKCGQIIAFAKDLGNPVTCCGEEMVELKPNTEDASGEKHVPQYIVDGNIVIVNVGSIPHPMVENHYIEWVALKTKFGNQRKQLKPGQAPIVYFAMCDGDTVEEVYAYCNLHGLWKN